jgi:D-alanine-D-alanine ligase
VTDRIRVAVLVGGASAEREISLASGKMIADHLPRDRYQPILMDTLALMARNPRLSPELRERAEALLVKTPQSLREPEPDDGALPSAFQEQVRAAAAAAAPATEALALTGGARPVDVAFIALHGAYGEDGTLQGMLELLGLPYVGSGVLASALAMDKAMAKKMMAAEGIPTPRGIRLTRAFFNEDRPAAVRLAEAVGVPAVVKPSRQGSSIGMSLVTSVQEMAGALAEAFRYDSELLVEERVLGTELTVGVIGNRELTALPVVEIVSKRAFFDYRAKYDPELSEEICPARLPAEAAAQAQELGLRAHRALGCRGLSRTDMILAERGPVVLEVNTLPGMTMSSLLPKAAAAAGIPFGELLHRLVSLALEPEE